MDLPGNTGDSVGPIHTLAYCVVPGWKRTPDPRRLRPGSVPKQRMEMSDCCIESGSVQKWSNDRMVAW